MISIENPILPGFNADPSAIRVGDYYYVVTSTFNWMSGVTLYRSKDLKNWTLVQNILDRSEQLDLRGNPDSCGIWAPQISYNDNTKLFYLVYTDVKNLSGSFFDLNNFVVSSESIEGPWSDPTFLNASGFDPSLFHDDDGRSWLLNLAWEFRDSYPHPGPIIIQEYDVVTNKFIGKAETLYKGNPRFGCTEGPHIFKKDGYYYLITAEGGTGYGHAVKIARSNNVLGPYIESPNGPLLTSRQNPNPEMPIQDSDFLKPQFYNPEINIQKAGHGSLVETSTGETALFHLSARPVMPQMRAILNRETSIQRVIWEDSWPVLAHKTPYPLEHVEFNLTESEQNDVTNPGKIEFNCTLLPSNFYSLKNIMNDSWCSMKRDRDSLSLRGRNSPYSAHDFSVVSRRVQHFNCDIETVFSFEPENPRHMAGLIIQTGSKTFYYLRYYFSESLKAPALGLMISLNGDKTELCKVPFEHGGEIHLKVSLRKQLLSFYYSKEGEQLESLGSSYDATVLSDEFTNMGPGAFDGTFVGMCVNDMDKQEKWADFYSFSYLPINEQ